MLLARTLPKWWSGIAILPTTEHGIEEAIRDIPLTTLQGSEFELERLSSSQHPSIDKLWLGNLTVKHDLLYRVLHRHSYTLRSLSLCNVVLDTSQHGRTGVVGQVILLIRWLRRECSLDQVKFYGRISDQFGTSIMCDSTDAKPEAQISRIEEYVIGRTSIAEFPFQSLQPYERQLLCNNVYSVGGDLFVGSKWRGSKLLLEEDHTWYVLSPSLFWLMWSIMAMTLADLLKRFKLRVSEIKDTLNPWKPIMMDVLACLAGASAFLAVFVLGMMWTTPTSCPNVVDLSSDISYICTTRMLRPRQGHEQWEVDYIQHLCDFVRT